jgi:DNA-binding GntR family transcriptional regulator
MHTQAADDRRSLSAAIFGNRAAADVIHAIEDLTRAGNRAVTTRMIARHTGLGDSVVRPVMLRLQSAGTLTAQPRDIGARSALHYEVQATELWDALRGVIDAIYS